MAKITIFYLENCPYCVKARKAVAELGLNPADILWIEESRQPEVADRYDYYHVPTVYVGGEKLYECSPGDGYEVIKAGIKAALEKAV